MVFSALALTIVSCIGANMRTWRVVRTATRVDTKRNAGCHVDANKEGASSGLNKKTTKKSSVKQISSHEDEEEEGYT
jgi:hypothetical protein